MIHHPTFKGRQTVERIEILVYLDADTLISVDAILVNGDLRDMDLKGKRVSVFNDLETDVIEGLKWCGYQVDETRLNSIRLSYFEKFK